MEIKPTLIDLLNDIHQEVHHFVDHLSAAERAALGEPDHWEAKDLIGHLATWKDRMIDTLDAIGRGEAPPSYGDFEHANAIIFKSHRDQPWEMVITLLEAAHTRMIRYLEATSEATLTDPERDPRRSGRSLWRWIVDIAAHHPLEHLANYRITRGQPDQAVRWWETFLPKLTGLTDEIRWRTINLYQIALVYTAAGVPDKAVATLGEIFQLRPELIERLGPDPGFDPLRGRDDFQALFPPRGIKDKLIDLIQIAHQEELAFLSRLTDAERAVAGTAQAWSARDLMGHIITWAERGIDRLDAAARGEPLPDYGEIDAANAQIFAENAAKTWDDLRSMIDQACTRTTAYIQAADEADLTDPERSPLKNKRPLWQNLVGGAVTHALLHLAQYDAEHGRADHATPLQERIAQQLLALDDAPKWHANTTYNLACYYALAGLKAPAIAKLGEALKLDPGLTEWSTQDSDLASIRDEAGYKALYTA